MTSPVYNQTHFRVRSGDTVGLNADSGWAAAEDTNPTSGTIKTGELFRIRFHISETADKGSAGAGIKLQANRNSTGWVDCDVLGGTGTPPVLCRPSSQYADGDATSTELLTNDGSTYVNGTGEEDNTVTTPVDNTESEVEFCVQIMSFWSNGSTVVQNVTNDVIAFRLVESDGTVFSGTYVNPSITIGETAGYVGGTFIESPGRIGPFCDGNGNLYAMLEPAELNPLHLMIKSTDGGDTWREMDSANRPTNDDLESVAAVIEGDNIHIIVHPGGSTPDIVYHRFRVSTHATNPDTWEITDEVIHASSGQTDQACAIAYRSDGTIVGFYRRTDTNQNIKYRIRSSGGTWGSENNLDTTASTDFTGVMCVRGASDKIHIFYKDDTNGDIYHKSLTSGDSLSSREAVETDARQTNGEWAMTPAIYWDDAGTEKIMVVVMDQSDSLLYSIVVTSDGTPETRKQASDAAVFNHKGGSEQPSADLVVDQSTDTAYLLYGKSSDGGLYRDSAVNDGGWSTDVSEVATVSLDFVRGQVFTHSSGNGGAKVLGYLYDDNAAGGNGQIRYGEYVISAGGTGASDSQPAYMAGQASTSDSQPAYMRGEISVSDSQPAYMAGETTVNDSKPAYIAGVDTASSSKPAYMAGEISVQSAKPAFMSTEDSVSDSSPAYMSGEQQASDSKSAFMSAVASALDNKSAYMYGEADATDAAPAYMAAEATTSTSVQAFVSAEDSASDATPAYMAGEADVLDASQAYMAGEDYASDSAPAYMSGEADVADARSAYLSAEDYVSTSSPAYMSGALLSSDSAPAYMSGQAELSDSTPAYMSGEDVASDSAPAFMSGVAGLSGNAPAFMHGEAPVSDSSPAYMGGELSVADNKSAYMYGEEDVSDSSPAYMVGEQETQDSAPAYISGGLAVSSSKSAYMVGGGNPADDSQPAYMSGEDTTQDSAPAFIRGEDTLSDSVPVFMAGIVGIVDGKTAYLRGSDILSGSTAAFMSGELPTADSAPAYMSGEDVVSGSAPAYLSGQTEIEASASAYLSGSLTVNDNKPAYMAGLDAAVDSLPAYMAGQDTASSSIPAFMVGGIVAASSKSAYMAGAASAAAPLLYLTAVIGAGISMKTGASSITAPIGSTEMIIWPL